LLLLLSLCFFCANAQSVCGRFCADASGCADECPTCLLDPNVNRSRCTTVSKTCGRFCRDETGCGGGGSCSLCLFDKFNNMRRCSGTAKAILGRWKFELNFKLFPVPLTINPFFYDNNTMIDAQGNTATWEFWPDDRVFDMFLQGKGLGIHFVGEYFTGNVTMAGEIYGPQSGTWLGKKN